MLLRTISLVYIKQTTVKSTQGNPHVVNVMWLYFILSFYALHVHHITNSRCTNTGYTIFSKWAPAELNSGIYDILEQMSLHVDYFFNYNRETKHEIK